MKKHVFKAAGISLFASALLAAPLALAQSSKVNQQGINAVATGADGANPNLPGGTDCHCTANGAQLTANTNPGGNSGDNVIPGKTGK